MSLGISSVGSESNYNDQFLQSLLQSEEGRLILDVSDNRVDALLAREDYGYYCTYTHNFTYHRSRHTDFICKKLEAVERGSIRNIMFFLPPQNSKSFTVSETFPSYFIGKNPNRKVIEISYGDDLARRFGRRNRSKIENFGKLIFNIEIERGNSSVSSWGIEGYDGYMNSCSLRSGITGFGADLLIIDDPIKNRQEADSPTYRKNIWNEYRSTVEARMSPTARVILIQTRWHEDDLAGKLLSLEGNKWDVVCLPALAEENDLLGRKEGEPLWPERGYTRDWLIEKRTRYLMDEAGSRSWNSEFQQRPSATEGNLIKREWWRYYKVIPENFDRIIQVWDMTFKDASSSDGSFVVGQVWGRKNKDKFLLDQIRRRMNFTDTLRAVRQLNDKWEETGKRYIEEKANGTAIIDVLKKEIGNIIAVNPKGSKYARLEAVSGQIELGSVYLPDPTIATWVYDFIDELAQFPNGKYDDQVDGTSMALYELRRISRGLRMV